MPHKCNFGGCTTSADIQCSKCKDIGLSTGFYCSPEHQRSHWSNHKPICGKIDSAGYANSIIAQLSTELNSIETVDALSTFLSTLGERMRPIFKSKPGARPPNKFTGNEIQSNEPLTKKFIRGNINLNAIKNDDELIDVIKWRLDECFALVDQNQKIKKKRVYIYIEYCADVVAMRRSPLFKNEPRDKDAIATWFQVVYWLSKYFGKYGRIKNRHLAAVTKIKKDGRVKDHRLEAVTKIKNILNVQSNVSPKQLSAKMMALAKGTPDSPGSWESVVYSMAAKLFGSSDIRAPAQAPTDKKKISFVGKLLTVLESMDKSSSIASKIGENIGVSVSGKKKNRRRRRGGKKNKTPKIAKPVDVALAAK